MDFKVHLLWFPPLESTYANLFFIILILYLLAIPFLSFITYPPLLIDLSWSMRSKLILIFHILMSFQLTPLRYYQHAEAMKQTPFQRSNKMKFQHKMGFEQPNFSKFEHHDLAIYGVHHFQIFEGMSPNKYNRTSYDWIAWAKNGSFETRFLFLSFFLISSLYLLCFCFFYFKFLTQTKFNYCIEYNKNTKPPAQAKVAIRERWFNVEPINLRFNVILVHTMLFVIYKKRKKEWIVHGMDHHSDDIIAICWI